MHPTIKDLTQTTKDSTQTIKVLIQIRVSTLIIMDPYYVQCVEDKLTRFLEKEQEV